MGVGTGPVSVSSGPGSVLQRSRGHVSPVSDASKSSVGPT